MSASFSFQTPAASFSTIDLAINLNQDDNRSISSHHNSFYSLMTTTPKRSRGSDIHLQTLTTDNRPVQSTDDNTSYEDDQLLTSHYDDQRKKQEKLLLITNVFRLLIIFILAPIIYFLA